MRGGDPSLPQATALFSVTGGGDAARQQAVALSRQLRGPASIGLFSNDG
jgi:hypothetical protein